MRYPSDGLFVVVAPTRGGPPDVTDPGRGWGRLHRIPHDDGARAGGPRVGHEPPSLQHQQRAQHPVLAGGWTKIFGSKYKNN